MRSALVYGTFDPLTSGHLWLVSAGLRLFDRIVVAVALVVNREPVFTVEERVELWVLKWTHLLDQKIASENSLSGPL